MATDDILMLNDYVITGYVADNSSVYEIKLGMEDWAAQPTPDTGHTPTPGLPRMKISGSRSKSRGTKPRVLVLTRVTGTAPNIRQFFKRLPILLMADYNSPPATITINSIVWTLAGKEGEVVR